MAPVTGADDGDAGSTAAPRLGIGAGSPPTPSDPTSTGGQCDDQRPRAGDRASLSVDQHSDPRSRCRRTEPSHGVGDQTLVTRRRELRAIRNRSGAGQAGRTCWRPVGRGAQAWTTAPVVDEGVDALGGQAPVAEDRPGVLTGGAGGAGDRRGRAAEARRRRRLHDAVELDERAAGDVVGVGRRLASS